MAILALFTKPSTVRIDLLVTVEAGRRRIPELDLCRVTSRACDGLVSVNQPVVRDIVVEGFLVELDDVGFAPLVVGVALSAFPGQRPFVTAMQTFPLAAIGRNFLMAINT